MSPRAATHMFAIGEHVSLSANMRNKKDSAAIFVVKNRLPHVSTEFQYRIRAEAEPHDRVVTEGLLSRVENAAGDPEPAAAPVSTVA